MSASQILEQDARYVEAEATLARLKAVGISYENVTNKPLQEGVDTFAVSWQELNDTVAAALTAETPPCRAHPGPATSGRRKI